MYDKADKELVVFAICGIPHPDLRVWILSDEAFSPYLQLRWTVHVSANVQIS